MHYDALAQILVLIAAAVLVVSVFRSMLLPPILGYIAVGILLGPHAAGWISNTDDIRFLAEIGVVFLLFTLGLEFSLPRMIAMRWTVFGLGGAQVAVTTLVAALVAWWLGASLASAVIVGGAVAMSSTAIVIRQLAEQLELNSRHGRHAVGILLFQDLAVVLFLALIPVLAARSDPTVVGLPIWRALLQAAAALIIVLAAGHWLLRPLFHEIARRRSAELFTLTVLLVALGAAWATHAAGLSLALGAFLAGMMLGETEYRHQVEADIRPFRDIFLGLFFITMGMLLDLELLVDRAGAITLLVIELVVLKAAIITLLARRICENWNQASRIGLVLAQGGEFGFALLTLGLQDRLIPPAVAQPLLTAIVVSMALSPLLIRYNGRLAGWLFRSRDVDLADLMRDEAATAAVAHREHVIICGYGRVGQNLARILEQEGFEYIGLDLDPYRVRTARQGGDPVLFGDASQGDVLEGVGLAHASIVVISFADNIAAFKILDKVRSRRPDVPVLVRTQDDTDLERLQAAGATEVIPETLEASLSLVSHVLLLLNVPVSRVVRKIGDIRSHRYSLFRNIYRKQDARVLDSSHAFREQLQAVALPPGAHAVGRTLAELDLDAAEIGVTAIRRDGIVGHQPLPETMLKEDDVLVLYGTPEALEHGETLLLTGL
ncbi:MAG TPA: monovalent cation:proton antiporter-2 (CPA2) family protein [Gammaproteobacteria bacterium]|nr:monovalent cation:proton antiporter-2 (CPA2) family protein [Gammaproteobacteria bacterium]